MHFFAYTYVRLWLSKMLHSVHVVGRCFLQVFPVFYKQKQNSEVNTEQEIKPEYNHKQITI